MPHHPRKDRVTQQGGSSDSDNTHTTSNCMIREASRILAVEPEGKPQKSQKTMRLQLEKCEDSLADVMHELVSYSYLLRWLGPGADNAENLYGLGISLDRLGRRVAKTMERINGLKGRS